MWLSERDPGDQRKLADPDLVVVETFCTRSSGALGEEDDLREAEELPDCDVSDDGLVSDRGVITSRDDDFAGIAVAFVAAIADRRHWDRDTWKFPGRLPGCF